jgi:hypothetical protein
MRKGIREIPNGELHNFCFSKQIIKMIQLKQIGWTGHAACMIKAEMLTKL